jgi:ABC-type sugar transport system permease subunit
MVVGLVLMSLFTIYPILFTVWVSFTNYGEGHLVTKQQALDQILDRNYLPETGQAYKYTAFKSSDGEYALWLMDSEGNGFLAKPGEPLTQPQVGEEGVVSFGDDGIPEEIEGYEKLNIFLALADTNLPNIQFGTEDKTIQVRKEASGEAAELVPKYSYDSDQDMIIDLETGIEYKNLRGDFVSSSGQELKPGFSATIGLANFRRFFTSPALRGPLIRIVLWNFSFAILSLLLNFALGLFIAVLFNEPGFPFKKLIQTLLIIPYTIPALLTILIWRGMLNPEVGVISETLKNLFGWAPRWFSDPWWAKVAILLINLWLSYPYFMLVCSGSLQSISDDFYAAAQVDGANRWQQFWHTTLPLLLVAVGPLLISSFVFNFNSFNLIYIFNGGNPPIAGSPTPAGHTDILISYVYNLAYAGQEGGMDYGFAAAITIVIFFIVGTITLFQFRLTGMWEEVSENV